MSEVIIEQKEEILGKVAIPEVINGAGIKSIEQTSTSSEDGGVNTITVTLTDGGTSTFEVRNGSKGSQGNPGEKGEKGESAAQPNWNQNDETAPDYVKNRPFYEETTEIEMLPETSFEIVAENTEAIIRDSFPYTFGTGKEYTVTFDGEINTYTAVDLNGAIGIASLSLEEVMKGNGWACAALDGALILMTMDPSIVGTHTISISGPVTYIYKIDEKYLGEISFKMDKINPVGEGSFSLNRKANTGIGIYSTAEGNKTTASGNFSHAEGNKTTASGNSSHAEGNKTTASGNYSHAEGSGTASGNFSHAEGNNTTASNDCSHAEGYQTTASGISSHAEGYKTTASGNFSHAEGLGTIATPISQHVQGKWNVEDSNNVYAHIVGGGTNNADRKNIHTVDWRGNAWYNGEVGCTQLRLNSSTNGSTNKKVITVDDDGKIYVDGVDSSGSNEEYIERFTQKIFDTDGNLIGVNFSRYKIKNNAFKDNSTLTSVDFANGLSEIGEYAFNRCTNLALTSLPDSIANIGNYAFQGCTNLALTSLPDGITSIGGYAFDNCTKLELTSLPDSITNIGDYAFYRCTNLALTSLPDSITNIGDDTFFGCTNLALTLLSNNITNIGEYAFYGCTKLALTSLPEKLTIIKQYAFHGCTNLALTSLPVGIISIGSDAFNNCTKLALTSLPDSVTKIESYAFYRCTNLTTITFKRTPTFLSPTAFLNCTNLTTINVPWAERAVPNAPWGADNATINYNYTGE